ncbi:unnamed protein product [Clavelina lepadiformis]|uniref:Uncharacterized protein n=1 Tax=Clavelina lepadiformis TaxID=159417 RepID=A0ABP0G7Y1_CLALP
MIGVAPHQMSIGHLIGARPCHNVELDYEPQITTFHASKMRGRTWESAIRLIVSLERAVIEGLFGFLDQQNNDAWTEFHRALDFGEIPPKLGGSLHENLHESFQIDRQSRVNKPKLEFRLGTVTSRCRTNSGRNFQISSPDKWQQQILASIGEVVRFEPKKTSTLHEALPHRHRLCSGGKSVASDAKS